MQSFVIEPSFWDLFPEASVGCIVVRDMKSAHEVSQEDRARIATLLSQANTQATRHLDSPALSENAPIKVWRDAYKK